MSGLQFARWKLNWDQLMALLTANIGPSLPLNGVKVISRSEFPALGTLPAIGCQFKNARWSVIGQGARRVISTFAITVVTTADFTDAAPDVPQAALNALLPLVNDGTGNGLEPLLNTANDMLLGGTCVRTMITDLVVDTDQHPEQESSAIAYARFVFEVEDQVRSF